MTMIKVVADSFSVSWLFDFDHFSTAECFFEILMLESEHVNYIPFSFILSLIWKSCLKPDGQKRKQNHAGAEKCENKHNRTASCKQFLGDEQKSNTTAVKPEHRRPLSSFRMFVICLQISQPQKPAAVLHQQQRQWRRGGRRQQKGHFLSVL